jgi:hypothetical protein
MTILPYLLLGYGRSKCTLLPCPKFGERLTEELISNGKTGAIDQLVAALTYPWMTYGSIKKVDSNGNLRIYYTNEITGGGNGYKDGMYYARANPTNKTDSSILAGWIAEIFEVITNSDDLGGPSSQITITNIYYGDGNLNAVGKDLFAYCFVKDSQKIGATATANNMAAKALSAKLGNAEVGFEPASGEVRAGYNGKNVRVGAQHSRYGTDANAGVEFGRFKGAVAMSLSPGHEIWSADAGTSLEKIALSLSGMYDSTGANRIGFTIGNKPKVNQLQLQAGYERQDNKASVQQAVHAQAAFNIPKVGLFVISGNYSTAEGMAKAQELALNVAAQLNLQQFGVFYVNGNYSKAPLGNALFSISLQKPIGPGMLDFGLFSMPGQKPGLSIRYSIIIPVF